METKSRELTLESKQRKTSEMFRFDPAAATHPRTAAMAEKELAQL